MHGRSAIVFCSERDRLGRSDTTHFVVRETGLVVPVDPFFSERDRLGRSGTTILEPISLKPDGLTGTVMSLTDAFSTA